MAPTDSAQLKVAPVALDVAFKPNGVAGGRWLFLSSVSYLELREAVYEYCSKHVSKYLIDM